MGWQRHHAIVVTHWNRDKLVALRDGAVALVASVGADVAIVSPVSEAVMNGYASFAIFPDGSKEGLRESNKGDLARELVIRFLKNARKTHDCFPAWVEVEYGEVDAAKVTRAHTDAPEDGDA